MQVVELNDYKRLNKINLIMKKLFRFLTLTLLSSIIFSGCNSTLIGAKASPELMFFESILDITDKDKNEIYIKANSWFVETFNHAESVIEFQDKESGKIIGKYTFNYNEGIYSYMVKQTVDIEMKDQKIRIKIYNPFFKVTSGLGETYHNAKYKVLETEKGIAKAQQEWKELSASLEAYLNTVDDWQ